MFAPRRLVDAEGIDLRIEVHLLSEDEDVCMCIHCYNKITWFDAPFGAKQIGQALRGERQHSVRPYNG